MGVLDNIQDGISSIEAAISQNPLMAVGAVAATGLAVGAGACVAITKAVTKKKKKSKKSKKKSSKSKKKSGRKLKFGSKAYRKKYLTGKRKRGGSRRKKQRQPHTAGKRRDTSHRRIRYTKNNQPYIILASGKARFIKRSSVTRSRKLKGGRY